MKPLITIQNCRLQYLCFWQCSTKSEKKPSFKAPSHESGQTTVEYILLLAIVTLMFTLMVKEMGNRKLAEKLVTKLNSSYAMIYQYGDKRALSPENGGPRFHPRVVRPSANNFKIFINPEPAK